MSILICLYSFDFCTKNINLDLISREWKTRDADYRILLSIAFYMQSS